MLIDQAIDHYEELMLEELVPNLVGTNCLAKAPNVPPGTQLISQDKLMQLKRKAKRGAKGSPIPRETSKIQRKMIQIPEMSFGFTLHRKDLQASQNAGTPLPDTEARMSTRKVMEALELTIFQGLEVLDIPGIYSDAGKEYTVDEGSEWNTDNAKAQQDVNGAFAELEEDNIFTGKKLILASRPYRALNTANIYGISPMDQVAKLMPNGMSDIIKAPSTISGETIIPADGGLLCDYGNTIAERVVEEEVNLQQDFAMDENNLFPFNILTYQTQRIHEFDAFCQLKNLVDLDRVPLTP
jgi:uncharacterized linocin/CFP29 family protein